MRSSVQTGWRLKVQVSREGNSDQADFRIQFTDYYGAKVKAFVRYWDRKDVLDVDADQLKVDVITAFERFSHVRLSDGSHYHVSNDLLSGPPKQVRVKKAS